MYYLTGSDSIVIDDIFEDTELDDDPDKKLENIDDDTTEESFDFPDFEFEQMFHGSALVDLCPFCDFGFSPKMKHSAEGKDKTAGKCHHKKHAKHVSEADDFIDPYMENLDTLLSDEI